MSNLVIAEHDQNSLKSSTLSAVTAALAIGGDVDILVCGKGADDVAKSAALVCGVSKVIHVDNEIYEHQLAESVAPLVSEIGKTYSGVLTPATTTGKNLLPRVAALLDVSQISDIVNVKSNNVFQRPIYAGNAIATVESSDSIKVITVRATAFSEAEVGEIAAPIEDVSLVFAQELSQFIGERLSQSERPELTSAGIIISGGRGMQNGENFQLLEKVADKLNAAVGASRAAVDAGFVPNDYQVGQTGKIVAPDLYIAVGISGAIQHLAGMKDSKVIVAINKDEEAPIFQIADYGLVADLFAALPELEGSL